MEKGFSRGHIVIDYKADSDTLLSLINQINEKARDLSILSGKLFDALQETVTETVQD